ncbi:copper resistance CopC family protein [Dongia rigui]|uniref:Copper resistance protein CopC n=1 Tax=Dongia rigui TaxID=940149 RepID=A0ABU5E195_9PROT|nr:copper resistance protein CopC [Dongia rigui]MDY0873374.1 copper resistance protein CopC [Dongia rigui]
MNSLGNLVRNLTLAGLLLVVMAAPMATPALAHAIIVSSVPAAGATVAGPDIDLAITFNVRVDADRSKLTLTGPDGSSADIAILPNDSPAVLSGHLTGLKAGVYSVRWQVLATDGHITRGDVNFTVTP